MLQLFPESSSTSWIWQASSRVGAMHSMMGRPRLQDSPSAICARICAIPGRPNARVFPEPVEAMPTRSRPESITGQLWAWMAEGSLKDAVHDIRSLGSPENRNSMMGAREKPSTVISCFWRMEAISFSVMFATSGCSLYSIFLTARDCFASSLLPTGAMVADGSVTGEGFDFLSFLDFLEGVSSSTPASICQRSTKAHISADWPVPCASPLEPTHSGT
mmetsp:Transcript_7750/g.22069  ORF Transcript_7750/g.22069 Transcript_7750/m.22069 type:complete len:218 (+) Transcript_7750:1300-1953(+)